MLLRVLAVLAMLGSLSVATPSLAVAISVMVGDNDGYGFGVPDNGTAVWPGPGPSGSDYDGRSAGEAAATNGAQITDVYSAIFPTAGPNGSTTASVRFGLLPGTLLSGSLTIDMGDFQSTAGGPISADVNGIPLPFAFDDGFQSTVVRDFALNAAMIAAANLAGEVILNLDHSGSFDFIAFDFFTLNAEVPEPGTMLLLGIGLLGLGVAARRRGVA